MSAVLEDFFTMADVNLSLDLLREIRETTSHRVKRFGFGDGYEQIASDGANTRITKYNVTTRPLSTADASALRDNLDKVIKGDYFVATLTPFSTESRRYRIDGDGYTRKLITVGEIFNETMEFTLKEAYSG